MINRQDISHRFDFINDYYESAMKNHSFSIECLQRNFKESGSIAKDFAAQANQSIFLNKEKKASVEFLELALEGYLLTFKLAMKKDQSFTQTIGGKIIEFQGMESTAYTDTGTWEKAVYIALILRNKSALDFLCSVPLWVFQNTNAKGFIEFDYHFVEVIKGIFNPNASMFDLFMKSVELSMPDKFSTLNKERKNYIDCIMLPELKLIQSLVSDDANEFNENLKKALLAHKRFWSTKKNEFDNNGWVSLRLTGICSLIWDNKKFPIEVESDYLPIWLVKNEF